VELAALLHDIGNLEIAEYLFLLRSRLQYSEKNDSLLFSMQEITNTLSEGVFSLLLDDINSWNLLAAEFLF
jgi:hypothetical protein